MKLWKRSGIVLMFALALALLCLHGSCSAKGQRGTWKKNTRWEFDTRTKTLTISCRGKMEESVSCMGKFPGWDSTKVKKVVFRPGITYIGDMNMDYPKLEEVVLPEGLVYIGNVFGRCPRLKKLRFPSTLRRIGLMAFEEADNLQSVTMPGVEKIGSYAFLGCNLRSLNLPDTCRRIGRGAFENNPRIRSVTIPSGVKKIGKWTFADIKNLL